MHVSPDPITNREEAAEEREKLIDFLARGVYCTAAHGDDSSEGALTAAKAVADDYLSAYEEWMVRLAADNAGRGPQ